MLHNVLGGLQTVNHKVMISSLLQASADHQICRCSDELLTNCTTALCLQSYPILCTPTDNTMQWLLSTLCLKGYDLNRMQGMSSICSELCVDASDLKQQLPTRVSTYCLLHKRSMCCSQELAFWPDRCRGSLPSKSTQASLHRKRWSPSRVL